MNIRAIRSCGGRLTAGACRRQPASSGSKRRTAAVALVLAGSLIAGSLSAAQFSQMLPGDGTDPDFYASSAPRFSETGRFAIYRGWGSVIVTDRALDISQRLTLPGTAASGGYYRSVDIDLQGRRISFERTYSTGSGTVSPPGFPSGIYVHDLNSGEFRLVSRKPGGKPIRNFSQSRLSGDGRHVVFVSTDSDLVPDDTNGEADVFVLRVSDGQIERVSVATDGSEGRLASGAPSINADGSRIAFRSADAGLVAGDSNLVEDIFVRDRRLGLTRRVSVGTGGVQANGASMTADISDRARTVVFSSAATNLGGVSTSGNRNVYLHDLFSGTTELVSPVQDPDWPEGSAGANRVSVSADGRHVAFGYSLYPNNSAEAGDDNVSFVFSRDSGRLARLPGGGPYQYGESISPDGSVVGFAEEFDYRLGQSAAPRVYTYDTRPFCRTNDPALQTSLTANQWKLLSLPCEPPAGTTVVDLFGDDIPGIYGTDWVVFEFVTQSGVSAYRQVTVDGQLQGGRGYWLVSRTGGRRTLDLPAGSRALPTSFFNEPDCGWPDGCHAVPLSDFAAPEGAWRLAGSGSARRGGVAVSDFRFVTAAGSCAAAGCSFDEASSSAIGLLVPALWSFDGSAYNDLDSSSTVLPWQGFWVRTLPMGAGNDLQLRVPGGTD